MLEVGVRTIMIKTVIKLQNSDIIVFDAEGEQIPEYQGRYQGVKEKILSDALPDTVFVHWFGYATEPRIVSREEW